MEPANLFNLFAAALGWMVLHSVWQIALVYLLFRVAARIWRKQPRAVYHAAHPLFWLLSKEAHRQREYCCDDLVLRHRPDRLLYAKTLTDLHYTHLTLNQFAMPAIGKSAFAQRIFRLFNLKPEKAQRSPGLFILGIVLLVGTALGWSSFTQKPQPGPSELALVFPDKKPAPAAPAANAALSEAPEPALVIAPDTVSPSVIAVEATNMNIFYIGVDNPITVAAPGYECADLTVRLLGPGTLTALGDCRYNVVATAPGELGIAVFSQKNNLEKELGVKMYRVKRIPADPAVRFEQNNTPRANPAAVVAPTPAPAPAEFAHPPVEFEPLPAAIPSPAVAVAANKMNVFYVGVNNPITVAVPGYKCGELELRLSGGTGTLIPNGDCRYFVRVSKPGAINVEVYTRKHKKEVQLGVQTFRAKWIPDPVPYLADYSQSNTISREEIRNAMSRKLEAVIENFDYDNAHCSVSKYTLAIREEGADVIQYVIRENKIPKALLDKLEELPVGSVIYILEPYAKCPGDSAPRILGDLVFKIVP